MSTNITAMPEIQSEKLFAEAQKVIPGGVNSPVRACSSVESNPIFVAKGKGSRITSADGAEYIDFVQSWGPLLLGHAHPAVTKAIQDAAELGTSYGAPCEGEILLAKAVLEAMPYMDMIRMVSSGTEATMSALRLARGYTGRDKLIKFEGCYHGHADPFLASAGSGVATLSIPGTPGVPAAVVQDTLLVPYNDLTAVEKCFASYPGQIAALIVEPIAGNMGLVEPLPGFLQGLRELCTNNKTVLIFDEVITGFRASYSGAQGRYEVEPDLTTLGKIIGGGLPVGAYGGKRELMSLIAPSGPVYQAGTLSGNPLAMAAGLATLRELRRSDYAALEKRTKKFCTDMLAIFEKKGIPVRINQLGSMFTIFFCQDEVTDFASAKTSDTARYTKFYKGMRENGILFAPSGFEVAMVSFAHRDSDFAKAIELLAELNL